MKKLLFIILLIVVLILTGCARKYECDVGTIDDDGKFQNIDGWEGLYSTTSDWWDFGFDNEDAQKNCEAHALPTNYNDSDSTALHVDDSPVLKCACKRLN